MFIMQKNEYNNGPFNKQKQRKIKLKLLEVVVAL